MTRILIVDDKEENLYYLRTVLGGHGFQVESASHGAEALVKARREPPDILISDLLMPVMDGYTLLRHWKADEALKHIPFIVYTATYTEDEDEQLALSLGADAFILKPAEPGDFLSQIREVQARAAAHIPPASKSSTGDEKELLKVYSQTLIRKLEEKTLQLEKLNQALQKDIEKREKIESALRESEAHLANATAAGRIGTWTWDILTDKVVWSHMHEELWGLRPGRFGGTQADFRRSVHPDDRAALAAVVQHAIDTHTEYVHEHRIVWPDGSVHWVSAHGVARYDAAGRAVQMSGVVVDITKSKLEEEKNQRLSRLYAVSSGINEAIVRVKDTQQLYEQACRIAVEQGGLVMAWVGLVDTDGKILQPTARWGRDEGYLDAVSISTSPDQPSGRGPAGQAFRAKIPACCNDIANDATSFATQQEALQRGYRSCAAFPLMREQQAVGVLVVYGDQAGYFEQEELQVLNALAENISFAIESHRREERRMQAEIALRESEGRYRTLFEYAPDGILIADARGTYLDANASALRMFGYQREEFVGLSVPDIVAREEIPQIDPALKALGAGADHHREWRFRRKDASLFNAEVIAASIPDGNLLAMIRDITERHRAEARFRQLVDSNAQGVMFWSAKGEITGANDALLHMLGYSREELLAGKINWETITPPEYMARDREAFAEIKATGICAPFEKEYLRKDGSRVPILSSAGTFEDNPDEGFSFVVDLTERKKLEQQFLRAQRMESIGTLAGGIAHDLNNVLGPIIMALDLLKVKFTDAPSQELISMIALSAQRGAQMVSQVLSFARGVGGQKVELQLKHVVRDLQKIANETFLKNVEVRTAIANDLWVILGDPTQLHQLLLNLCVNARDAMPNGGQLLISAENLMVDSHYASLTREAKPGPYVLLKVQDTGIGIASEILDKIFDPFFTTKEVGKGTGLGLATTMGIVKSHGGFIQVESTPGKGTIFKIWFPAQIESTAIATEFMDETIPQGKGELVLVVDDETVVREITRETLVAHGYRVCLASDGAEAVAAFAINSREIGAVIIDLMMPVMDGYTTITALHRMNGAVPIIATSGLLSSVKAGNLTSLGAPYFLSKPYTAVTLLNTLQQALAGQPSGAMEASPAEKKPT